eukprot:1149422-Pelagomonas_calceolata.AAC.5
MHTFCWAAVSSPAALLPCADPSFPSPPSRLAPPLPVPLPLPFAPPPPLDGEPCLAAAAVAAAAAAASSSATLSCSCALCSCTCCSSRCRAPARALASLAARMAMLPTTTAPPLRDPWTPSAPSPDAPAAAPAALLWRSTGIWPGAQSMLGAWGSTSPCTAGRAKRQQDGCKARASFLMHAAGTRELRRNNIGKILLLLWRCAML